MFSELGGKSVTLVSDAGVQHFAFKCVAHDMLSMATCQPCLRAMRAIRDIEHHRRGMPEFAPEQLEAFWEGWRDAAAA